MPNIEYCPDSTTSAQTIMSTEESAIFEKEKSRPLDEVTKASTGRQRRTKSYLTEPNPLESGRSDMLANSINRAHEDSVFD